MVQEHEYCKERYRQTENRGKIQRHICRDCGRSFCTDDGFYRMRNSPEKITAGIDLYFRNYYNFIKPHNSINGSTPALKAGIGVEMEGNRWMALLKKSMENQPQRNKEAETA